MLEPGVEHRGVVDGRARALLVHHAQHAVEQRRVAFVEHEQDGGVAGPEVAVALDGVVEPQHRRRRAAPQDAPARVEAVDERCEAVRGSHLGGRRRVHAQPGAGDDPERALAAHEHLGEVGSDRRARRAAGVDGAAVGEDDVEAEHHVLDLPVAGGELARAPAREPPADGREVDRLGPVPEGDAVLGAQRRPRGGCRTCPARTSSTSDVSSTSTMPSSAVRSSTTPPCTGMLAPHTPLRPAAAVSWHPGVVAQRGRPPPPRSTDRRRDHGGGGRDRGAVVVPDHGERPPVAAGRGHRLGRAVDRAHRRQPVEAARPGTSATRAAQRAHRTAGSRRSGARSASIDARYAATCGVALGVGPAEVGGEQLGDRRGRVGRRVARQQPRAGAADEHVVERARHLVRAPRRRPRRGGTAGRARAASPRSGSSAVSARTDARPRCRSGR